MEVDIIENSTLSLIIQREELKKHSNVYHTALQTTIR